MFQDCAIEASIHPTRLPKFKDQLVLGNLYNINDFDVVISSKRYRRTNHEWKIVFTDKTFLESVKERHYCISYEFFRLSSFTKLLDLADKGDELPGYIFCSALSFTYLAIPFY